MVEITRLFIIGMGVGGDGLAKEKTRMNKLV